MLVVGALTVARVRAGIRWHGTQFEHPGLSVGLAT